MTTELPKNYDPRSVQDEIYQMWLGAGAFHAQPAPGGKAYSIVIPPPNVTAALHLGHALNNTLQDILARWKRMAGFNTLWMPGTDHAGIATQTVVEKRILAEEGRKRTDFSRQEFVQRVQAWKDQYETRILGQLKAMGCSCDWERTRFTMDETCARAVREAFFKLFADGMIYRGKRLVNWDPATQTVLADDEVEHETVNGSFWYLRYPLEEPVVVPRGMGVPPMRPEGVSPSESADVQKRQGSYLPHWTQAGATYAVSFRLADALPQHILDGWVVERESILRRAQEQERSLTRHEEKELDHLYSQRVEAFLDAGHGQCALKDESIAGLVQDALLHFDGQRYDLIAWCVMPNHVHAILQPLGEHQLQEILHSWKSFTAKQADKMLGRSGGFWQEEYYDHIIRDEEDFNHQVNYVLSNPQKAGLRDWAWVGWKNKQQGQDAPATHGRDAHATKDGHAPTEGDTITHITVATTRPETMLGDTAVAMNPADPRAKFLVGKKVRLPLVGRLIPIIADDHVVLPDPNSDNEKARYGTGFLKVTPAHDVDDYQIGQRHNLPLVNVLAPDGTISDKHGWTDAAGSDAEQFIGMDRFEAREAIVEFFRTEGLLEDVKPYAHEVGHSYRSHVPIEPYLSDQWYIAVKKPISNCQLSNEQTETKDGITYLKDTDVPVNSLAGLALIPLLARKLKFVPDRYANNYRTWLENLRDWPISRQLWWGHQIPVWSGPIEKFSWFVSHELIEKCKAAGPDSKPVIVAVPGTPPGQGVNAVLQARNTPEGTIGYVSVPPGCEHIERQLEEHGISRDTDVLDTWFSSALWPISTMGWPEENDLLKTFYPTSVLCTAREIITLWVSRMVMFGQYFRHDIPFRDVYIHAMIQDGEGRKMSKSLGNGIDPLDIIESHGADAMRFTLAFMTTQTQDVRMPVAQMTLPDGRKVNSSAKFDMGRNFCNKLWNAARFAMMNLKGTPAWEEVHAADNLADAWILSRLNRTARDVTEALSNYEYHEAAEALYRCMWNDFCDWYLEIAKVRINAGEASPKAVLAHTLDMLLRLLHPMIPFITEQIWQGLNAIVPVRGPGNYKAEPMLVKAAWPSADAAAIQDATESRFETLQALISGLREVRNGHNIPPVQKLSVVVVAEGAAAEVIQANRSLVESLAGVESLRIDPAGKAGKKDATVLAGAVSAFVLDVVDPQAEAARLTKRQAELAKGISGAQGKLSNPKFVERAKPEIVAAERERLAAMQAELDSVEKSLKALG